MQPDGWSGACWAFVRAKFAQFMFGRYPVDERWRVILTGILFVALLVPLLIPRVPYKGLNAILFFARLSDRLLLPAGRRLLRPALRRDAALGRPAGDAGAVLCRHRRLAAARHPAGARPALEDAGRQAALASIFIETVRGVPLITVLFMASVMLPLFLPPGVTFDKLLRALIGVALFASAYMAEVVRGGLQAIPKGQYEGADSLGLGYWQKMRLIVLPQALKLVIPGIVNTFIGLFKDTSLVYIIGMFDLLGIVQQNFSDANWATPQTPMTGLVFAGFVFWMFCFGMSRYSIYMERRLDTGHKR